MEDQHKKDIFDQISVTKIRLLEFFLQVPENKLQKFLKLEPDLCCVPLRNHNGQALGIKALKGISKRLIKKNVFVKSLLRDAWVITRLRVYYLFKLANIHMEKVDLDKYQECIKEAEKEIINRLNTHEDEEAHVFNALLKIEELKQHVRAHDLDMLISDYERIKEYIKKIKETDFGYLLNLRINASVGYAAKLISNDIVLPQRFHQVVQIYTTHYEEKKQVVFVDGNDHFIYYFSQLQLCKYMQRVEQISQALELAQRMKTSLMRKKLKMKAKLKEHLFSEFTHFFEACISFLQNDQSPRIFDCKKNMKKKKEMIIQSLFNFYDDKEEQLQDKEAERLQKEKDEIDEAELNKLNIKYQQDYKLVGSLSKYLNNLQVKKEDKQMGIFGFTKQNQKQQQQIFEELQEKILQKQNDEQQQENLNQQIEDQNLNQQIEDKNLNQKQKTVPSQKSIVNIISCRNIQQINLVKSKTNPPHQEEVDDFEEKLIKNEKRMHTEGDKEENNFQSLDTIFDYFGQEKQNFMKNKLKVQKQYQKNQNYFSNEPLQTEKMKVFHNQKEKSSSQRSIQLNQQRLSLTLNSNQLKNINFDELNKQKVQSTKSINSIKSELLIQDFVSQANQSLQKKQQSSESELFQQPSSRAINFQSSNNLLKQEGVISDRKGSQKQIIMEISERLQSQQSDNQANSRNNQKLLKDNQIASGEYQTNSAENYIKDEFQIFQNKFSVTIEKDTPNGVESQLEQFKNHFFKSSSSNNIKININQPQHSQSSSIEKEEQAAPQIQIYENQQNEQNKNETLNNKKMTVQIVKEKDNLAGKHKKSKTLQQFDKITSFLDLYRNDIAAKQTTTQSTQNSNNSIKIIQKIHKFNNQSQNQIEDSLNKNQTQKNQNEILQNQNEIMQNQNEIYSNARRNHSLRDSNSSRFNNIPKESSQQHNNFITESSLQNQSQITTQQSQRNQSLKIKIIPSEVEKFHLAPFFSQKNMMKHLNHRKKIPSQQAESFQSPNKSLVTQTQINSSSNMNFQSQTKETNQSNLKYIETLNTEKSFLSNTNSNNYFQQIPSPPNNNNIKITYSGNKIRKLSLLSSNKTINQPFQIQNQDAVLEENNIESEDDQGKSIHNKLNSQNKIAIQQKLKTQQNSNENPPTNINSIFNKINKRKSHQSTFTVNQSGMQTQQNIAPKTQRNSMSDLQESYQLNKASHNDMLENVDTDIHSLSSQTLQLSLKNTGRSTKNKNEEEQQNKIKEYFQKQNQTFGNDEKYGLLQLYLNKMLYVNPYDYLPKKSPKEVYSFMKNKFTKTETSQSQSSQMYQLDDIQQSNDQIIENVQFQDQAAANLNAINQQLQVGNEDFQQIRKSSFNSQSHNKFTANHKSLDFIFAQQQMQLSQAQMHKHSQTQTSNLQQQNVPSININLLAQHRNSISTQQNSITNQQNRSFLSLQRNSVALNKHQNVAMTHRNSAISAFSEPRASQYLKEDLSQQTPQIKINSNANIQAQEKKSSDPKHKSNNNSLDENESEKLRITLIEQIQMAKDEIKQEQRQSYSKQVTLFTLNSLHSQESIGSGTKENKSKFAPQSTKISAFKPKLFTKNSFDSDKSDQSNSPVGEKTVRNFNLLKRSKAFEKIDDEEEEIGSQSQHPSTQMHSATSPNNDQVKSINSIAFILASKKNWFKVQNKELTLSQRVTRQQIANDEISQKIMQLRLKFPSFCFSTHRIGRFQNWNVRYVEYYHENKCFQINFLGADNLFYKMFIPAKQLKDFNHSQNKFITIWPIILDYLQDYMEQKKIILKFSDDTNQQKKIEIKDSGISKYFQENKIDSTVTEVINKIIAYKNRKDQIDQNESLESIKSESSDEEESQKDLDSDEKINNNNKNKKKNPYRFFLGLARKNSYFPTPRDALAAAKIKKIFEILLFRYMYDQLRPTGKKLILKKDASTQKYKTLSKKIQKLENDLEKNTFNQLFKKAPTGNSIDKLTSQKFGMLQLRQKVQKDLMKIPDKQEYQIEQIWKLRYRENLYQLCSFILKTKENWFYFVSLNLAFKKDHNALLQVFLKKNSNKSLKDSFEKIISIQLLHKPKQEKNIEEQIQEQQLKEQKILQLIELQQQQESTPNKRYSIQRNQSAKLSTFSQNKLLTNIPTLQKDPDPKKSISRQKIFQEGDFKEILRYFDLNSIIRGIVTTQKIPKTFKNIAIKNIKKRIVITEEQLFLRLDKIDIISRKMLKHPPIIVQQDIPDSSDPRMRDFLTKQTPFNPLFDYAYKKSDFRQEKGQGKQHNLDQSMDLSSEDSDDFHGFLSENKVQYIKEVQEDFEKIEKAEKANNYYFEELHFKCSCNMKQSNDSIYLKYQYQGTVFYLKVTMHGEEHTENDHFTENIHAHLDITVIAPKLRFRKTYSTSKRKALLLFNSFKKIKYKNAFDPPIFLKTRKRIELDFQTNIQRVSRRKTIGEIMQRKEVKILNLSELPSFEILKLALLKNSSQMESLRSFKRFSIVDQIGSFGKVVVTMTIFHDFKFGKLYSLEFQDFTSKSRLYRIALNDNDLGDLFGIKLYDDDNGDTIIKIIRRICYHVRFEQQNVYRVPFLHFREEQYRKGLSLNKRNLIDRLRKNEFYGNYRRFYNKIVKYTFEKENLNKNKKLYLIDAQRKHSRIIFHKVFFHQNEYFIMTIKKSLVLQQFWMIFIYVPKTSRRIMGYIQSRDIEQIQFQNLNKDMGLFEIYDRDQPFKSYQDFITEVCKNELKKSPVTNQVRKKTFLREFQKKLSQKVKTQNSIQLDKINDGSAPSSPDMIHMDNQYEEEDQLELPSEDEPVKQIPNQKISPRLILEQQKIILPQKIIQRHEKRYGTHIHFNPIQEEQTDTQMKLVLEEKFHQITGQISKAYKQSYVLSYRLSNLSQFVEMKIWEDITSKMVLKYKGQSYVMQMGNISVPMQEFINSNQIQTDQGPEIFVEYFIGKQHNQGEYLVTQSFEEISYPSSLHYYIYLRFYHFSQVGIMHKKVNLRELLNLFIADGYYKYQTNYMHSKLQLQDLVQLCDFVSYKLKTGTYGSILNQNQFQYKRTGLESYSRKTLQTLVKEQEQEEGENGVVEKFVFQPKPYSIVKVYIKRANRIVEFVIYTPSTFQTFKKKYNISEISLSIPFINLYLKAGLYRPLARNILKLLHKELSFHLKNSLKQKQISNI
ncbi:hypothetical protein TTHERM_00641270 (macronuclear) [Tetrahymena thermophila SB210]|uniref:Uncharacterized protein n=1 Tax=Tetrahymena thermophila (strain SB210) TaxID=312017 RepID=Q23F06_TETTS|nr:hypothetical protein TTHERM_00641270 [Tetrahymena thermophila SB210]EAR95099.2 hypothetical protein TTHERM_00641270 [Tetrahymena thermophila SB210]|eukprot:XP_001015344.2 hypothetical protein TTHERM_00641270 [Tetrahymena thermophila SB210]